MIIPPSKLHNLITSYHSPSKSDMPTMYEKQHIQCTYGDYSKKAGQNQKKVHSQFHSDPKMPSHKYAIDRGRRQYSAIRASTVK